jgi:hypothetical protein
VKENETIICNFSSSGNYDECDPSFLYSIIRNLCTSINPTDGWNNEYPPEKYDSIGDDVKRMHLTRNIVYGHVKSARMKNKQFEEKFKVAETICI